VIVKHFQYEEDVFSISYPSGKNVPQPSYGSGKGHPQILDDGVIIRSDAAFALGSSGGGLFDEKIILSGSVHSRVRDLRGIFIACQSSGLKS
jgi:hypothetical protein